MLLVEGKALSKASTEDGEAEAPEESTFSILQPGDTVSLSKCCVAPPLLPATVSHDTGELDSITDDVSNCGRSNSKVFL